MANITMTALAGNKTLGGIATIVNTATDNVFWNVLIISVFIIFLVNTLKYGFDKAVLTSCFIILIPTLFLYNAGWISIVLPVIFAIGLAGSLMYIYFNNT